MACTDMVIVFSGFRDDSLKGQIEAAGGKVASSLVKAATHLVVKRDGKASKKVDEAREKGMEVIYLDDFLEEYGLEVAEKEAKPKAAKAAKPTKASEPEPPRTDLELMCELMNALNNKSRNDKTLQALEEITKRIKAF